MDIINKHQKELHLNYHSDNLHGKPLQFYHSTTVILFLYFYLIFSDLASVITISLLLVEDNVLYFSVQCIIN